MGRRISIVARRLKEARQRARLSQKRLGILAKMDEFSASARVNQYERGKHMPDLQTVKRLAAVLKSPVPYFYCADRQLANLILKIAPLGKAQKRRLLRLVDES
jgi:transcriptional regulator with XRE-family HTH domain